MLDLNKELQNYHADSISIAVIKEYQVRETMTAGPGITPHTRFQAASISKMVFALAVLRLVSEGKLALEADVNDYLGSEPLTRQEGAPAKASVRQILAHTAGINVHGFEGYRPGESLPTTAQIIAGEPPCNSPKVYQEYTPEEHWVYSGGGYMVLQRSIENITGQPFTDFMEDCILTPLGMTESSFRQDLTENLAYGCEKERKPMEGGHNQMPEYAAAGLWTTPSDMAKFGIHIQKILRGEEGVILQSLAQKMITPQHSDLLNMEGTQCRTGIGCYLKTLHDKLYFGHSGSNVGFESLVNFSVEGGSGSCIFVNGNGVSPLIWKVQEEILKGC